jgi:hypothetical protein
MAHLSSVMRLFQGGFWREPFLGHILNDSQMKTEHKSMCALSPFNSRTKTMPSFHINILMTVGSKTQQYPEHLQRYNDYAN